MQEPDRSMKQLPEDKVVPLNEATKIIVDNYTVAHEWKAQLHSLQEWVREQKKLTEKKD